jgi:hypothetical protein
MRRNEALTIAVVLLLASVRSTTATEPSEPGRLAANSDWVQIDIISGRITAHNARYKQRKLSATSDSPNGTREVFSVSFESQRPEVHYERVAAQESLSVVIVNGDQMEMRHESRTGDELQLLHFVQAAPGLTLRIANGGKESVYEAPGFWHLALWEPEIFENRLVPLLETLRTNWRLMETVENLEKSLLELASEGYAPPRRHLDQLVRQLGSDCFRDRQAADRELRRQGQSLFSYLEQLDVSSLNTEQRHRLKVIAESLAVFSGDTPKRTALQLAGDPRAYLMLLERDNVLIRELAAAQIERIQETPIRFDPSAGAQERSEQASRLRHLYLR